MNSLVKVGERSHKIMVMLEITLDLIFVLGLCPILFVRHLLDGGDVVGCFDEICIILLLFAVTLFAYYVAKITMSLTERGAIRRIGPDKGGVWEVLKK